MEPKRLYRNTSDKVIAGVCSGIGNYFVLDPLLIRLIFVVLTMAAGGGVLIYIILWISMPVLPPQPYQQQTTPPVENMPDSTEEPARPAEQQQAQHPAEKKPGEKRKGNLIGGLVLITLGSLFLIDEFIPRISFGDLWPIILVVIGIGLLINGISGTNQHPKSK